MSIDCILCQKVCNWPLALVSQSLAWELCVTPCMWTMADHTLGRRYVLAAHIPLETTYGWHNWWWESATRWCSNKGTIEDWKTLVACRLESEGAQWLWCHQEGKCVLVNEYKTIAMPPNSRECGFAHCANMQPNAVSENCNMPKVSSNKNIQSVLTWFVGWGPHWKELCFFFLGSILL